MGYKSEFFSHRTAQRSNFLFFIAGFLPAQKGQAGMELEEIGEGTGCAIIII